METCADCTTRYSVGALACPHCGSTQRAEGGTGGGVPLTVTVACTMTGCPHHGAQRLVLLRRAAISVAELPTLVCTGCGSQVSITWPGPLALEDNTMPKITAHGGATNAALDAEPDEGGEQPSPGTNSSTSSEPPQTSPASKPTAPPKRARTTASRSKPDPTVSSSAPSTDGGQEDGTSEDPDQP